jgi:hypothetical protein
MDSLSARALLECFHRYLDSDARWQHEIAPGVFEFCGAQVRDGSSTVDVACGTFRRCTPDGDYEVLSGGLLSIGDDIVSVHGHADRRVVELSGGAAIALPASPTVDQCIGKLLDGTRARVTAH